MLENMSPHSKRAGIFLLAAMVLASVYLLVSSVYEMFSGVLG